MINQFHRFFVEIKIDNRKKQDVISQKQPEIKQRVNQSAAAELIGYKKQSKKYKNDPNEFYLEMLPSG